MLRNVIKFNRVLTIIPLSPPFRHISPVRRNAAASHRRLGHRRRPTSITSLERHTESACSAQHAHHQRRSHRRTSHRRQRRRHSAQRRQGDVRQLQQSDRAQQHQRRQRRPQRLFDVACGNAVALALAMQTAAAHRLWRRRCHRAIAAANALVASAHRRRRFAEITAQGHGRSDSLARAADRGCGHANAAGALRGRQTFRTYTHFTHLRPPLYLFVIIAACARAHRMRFDR